MRSFCNTSSTLIGSATVHCIFILSALFVAGDAKGNIVYLVDHTFAVTGGDGGSSTLTIIGTMTTDGTIGAINPFSNLTAWSLQFSSDNLGPQVSTSSDGVSLWNTYNGGHFLASATELILEGPVPNFGQAVELQTSTALAFQWGTNIGLNTVTNLRVQVRPSNPGPFDEHFSGPYTSDFVFGTAVPEPSTPAFALLGMLMVMASRQRSRS